MGETKSQGTLTGEELKRRRNALGLTQTQLGEAIGFTKNYIMMMERGFVRISKPAQLEVLLRAVEAAHASENKPTKKSSRRKSAKK